jgi:multidrug efflux pump subunit AcrA (membrane-fusion protein)
MTPSSRAVRLGARAVAIAVLLLGVVGIRVASSARSELDAARLAADGGDLDRALVHYRRAARYYLPGSPYHVQALERLDALGRAAEADANTDRALGAYRAIRGSILATRSFYVPERARLEAADQRIAALMAQEPPPGMDAGKSKEQLRAEHLALLTAAPDPKLGWTLALLAGFAAFVGAAFAFSVRAIDDRDRFVKVEAQRWGALIVVGFALFALGLALA